MLQTGKWKQSLPQDQTAAKMCTDWSDYVKNNGGVDFMKKAIIVFFFFNVILGDVWGENGKLWLGMLPSAAQTEAQQVGLVMFVFWFVCMIIETYLGKKL